jgi:hypothetical protein
MTAMPAEPEERIEWAVVSPLNVGVGVFYADGEAEAREVLQRWLAKGEHPHLERRRVIEYEWEEVA